MYFLKKLKSDLAKDISKKLGVKVDQADFEYPPENVSDADLALPLFKLAKELGKNPKDIAQSVQRACSEQGYIKKAKANGPYVNFYINKEKASKKIIKELQSQAVDNNYVNIGKREKIMLEYVSPNSNKPLHLGHIRNAYLGDSLANILEFCGYDVVRSALINDRGIAMSKAMLAYKLWGKGDAPAKSGLKPDHFVGKYYVLFGKNVQKDKSLNEEAQKLLQEWESGDKEARALWDKMQKWVLKGYKDTYKKLGITFDKTYFESKLYKSGQKLAKGLLKSGVFIHDKNKNIIADLEKCNLPNKVMLRSDGTAIYSTTDIALAKKRLEEGFNKIYYVVGSEQDLYFKQLFCILKNLDLEKGQLQLTRKKDFKHLSYGLVELPEGKMKSREGTVVDADDLVAKMEELISEEVRARNDFIKPRELDKRVETIASAALRFYILSVMPKSKIKFNPKESISFTGKTGPYVLYSYARLNSILRKGSERGMFENVNYSLIDKEWELVWQIAKFPEIILEALTKMNPEDIASYLYNLSSKISDFYHNLPVLDADLPERKLRIVIIDSVLDVLKSGAALLGIKTLEEM